jgi:DNA-directed RNA polymerase specialized sigma24 family protein
MSNFPTTRRSTVARIASVDGEERRRAWETLVSAYWKPVYKYSRLKWKLDPDAAADLTQAFFARAIEKDFFRSYDPAKAAFRTFLRTCLDGFAANEFKAASRQKRGGDATLLSLDFQTAEGELMEHPAAPNTDLDALFHREWVRSVFSLSVEDLRCLCEARGKQVCFEIFREYDLDPAESVSYASIGAGHRLPVTTVTNHLAFARREFRRLVLERLREMTATDAEFRSEARSILGARFE